MQATPVPPATENQSRSRRGAGPGQSVIMSASIILISPAHMAHWPGCHHKDDNDFSRWGTLNTPDAWQRLGNGEHLAANGGARPGLVATRRCGYCVNHTP